MQGAEAGEHLTDVRLKISLRADSWEEGDDIRRPYPPEGNRSPQVRHEGKERVSVPTGSKVAGNRVPNMQMTASPQRRSGGCRAVSSSTLQAPPRLA